MRRAAGAWVLVALVALVITTPARAYISLPSVVAGPSASILQVGNAALAPDGTGGIVWRQLYGGEAHIFVSQYRDGTWGPPIQVDAGMPGPATMPTIAAGDGGELLVVWVAPWYSQSTQDEPPTTVYELFSAVMEPGASGFGPAEPVDPQSVTDGSAAYPQLAMAPDGTAYVVYRVVTAALTPGLPLPEGLPGPLRPGDQDVDVRVARFDGLYWSYMGAVNAFPGQVSMRKPTPQNAPAIAITPTGQGMVVWQEPTVDGVARIWARRLYGTQVGYLIQVSPETLEGRPVTADADAPSLSMGEFGNAEVAYRLQGGPGNPLGSAQIMTASIHDEYASGASAFSTPGPVAGGASISAPDVAVDNQGAYVVGYTNDGEAQIVASSSGSGPQVLGPATGDSDLAALDPDGGGVSIWPGTGPGGESAAQIRDTLPDGGWQSASLSAPLSGPVSSLGIGPSGDGDALIAFQQGAAEDTQVVGAYVEAPPLHFYAYTPFPWQRASRAFVSWGAATSVIGPVTYSVVLDGRTIVSGLSRLSYHLSSSGMREGLHRIRVIATDQAGQETVTPLATIRIATHAPFVRISHLSGGRIRVLISDRGPGVRKRGTLISFGDGSRPVRNRVKAIHAYARPGRYVITVRCSDRIGDRAADHLLVSVR